MENGKLQETVDKIKKETEELQTQNIVENMVKSNVQEFEANGVKYRINKPSFEQKQKANQERMKRFIVMLKNPEMLLEKDLIALYETRGINLKELDDKFNALAKQREELAEKLGKGLVDKEEIKDLEVYRKEIEKVIAEQNHILMQKSALLDSSIESQINVFVFTYLAYLTTQKYVHGADLGEGNKEPDPGWVTAWDSYETFLKQDETVVNQATWLTTYVNKSEVLAA